MNLLTELICNVLLYSIGFGGLMVVCAVAEGQLSLLPALAIGAVLCFTFNAVAGVRIALRNTNTQKRSVTINYLGANITQVGLNFSRPAAQILGQYYQFIRLGFQGYKEVQYNSLTIAKYIHDEIGKMAPFVNYSDEVVNPLFIWYLKPEYARAAKWTLYDLQDKLSQHGWMVPAYTLPSKLEDYVVMRVVVRQGFSRDMADMLLGDIKNAITELEKLDYPTPTRMAQEKNLPVETKIFNHGCRTHKK